MATSTALVTGGTGFIGLYVVKLLLERGHRVHTTVRSLQNQKKCKPLLDLQEQHPGRLELFEADLLADGSFKKGMQGCDVVYHVASPFLVTDQIKDGVKDCVEPALQGTKTVLDSVNETASVKRVVLTSSIAAMLGDVADVSTYKDGTLTEQYWNETSSITHNVYSYSKLVAEREAWKVCKSQDRWDLVVINPGLVLGPPLTAESASGSLHLLEGILRGDNKTGVPDYQIAIADVREVAEAHVKAGESPTAKGRYIIAGDHSLSFLDMANCVRPVHKDPSVLPSKNLPKLVMYAVGPFIGMPWKWVSGNVGFSYKVDNRKSREELGVVYRSSDEVLQEHYKEWVKSQGK